MTTPQPKRMPKRTEKAIRASIAHWIRLRDGKAKPEERMGARDCPLCQRFRRERSILCKIPKTMEPCPVYSRTGYIYCRDTPYEAVMDIMSFFDIEEEPVQLAIQDEIDFLTSLLPTKGTN